MQEELISDMIGLYLSRKIGIGWYPNTWEQIMSELGRTEEEIAKVEKKIIFLAAAEEEVPFEDKIKYLCNKVLRLPDYNYNFLITQLQRIN